MFLEYWQFACLFILFVIAMKHQYKSGFKTGSELTLDILESEKIIKINAKGEIKGVQSSSHVV